MKIKNLKRKHIYSVFMLALVGLITIIYGIIKLIIWISTHIDVTII